MSFGTAACPAFSLHTQALCPHVHSLLMKLICINDNNQSPLHWVQWGLANGWSWQEVTPGQEGAGAFLLLFLPWWLLFHAYCFILIFIATIPHSCYFNSCFMGHITKSWEHTEQVLKRERAHCIWFRIWKSGILKSEAHNTLSGIRHPQSVGINFLEQVLSVFVI